MKARSFPSIAICASMLAGCSLLYNPNNLPAPAQDAPEPDSPPIDVTALKVEAVSPAVLLEGQGDGGSHQAVVVVTGQNIGPDATLALLPSSGTSPIQVDNAHAARAPSGHVLAVPVTFPVDTGRATGTAELTIQVTQMAPTGPITAMVNAPVMLQYLPELSAPVSNPAQLAPLYSRVKTTAAMSFPASTTAPRVVIRAVSSIELGDVRADASGQTPGSGGKPGGATLAAGGGTGGGQPGNLIDLGSLDLVIAAGGGGYRVAGGVGHDALGSPAAAGGNATGDDLLSSYATNQSSGGGGGGSSPGGGGGGTIEITAGGTLKVGAVSANGGPGGAGGLLAGAAGGGSGGTIILRSGGAATLGTVTVNGGARGGANAGDGSEGRLRYDVPSLAGGGLPATARRGAAFAANVPAATSDAQPGFTLVSVASSDSFKLFVVDLGGTTTYSSTVAFGTPTVTVKPQLNRGYNRVCVTTPLGTLGAPESTSCIEFGHAR